MKYSFVQVITVFFALITAQSSDAGPVADAAAKMKKNDTRTVIISVNNAEGNPCLPEGKSYNIELQVKTASYNREKGEVEYTWTTVKTINSSLKGEIMEVCAE